jgi:hypothetical protein
VTTVSEQVSAVHEAFGILVRKFGHYKLDGRIEMNQAGYFFTDSKCLGCNTVTICSHAGNFGFK